MTKRLQVLLAVKAMIQAALPGVTVLGLENEGVAPDRLPPNGRVVIRAGDPGDPEIDLSPVTYNYTHQIPLEIAAYQSSDKTLTPEQAIDAILVEIAEAIKADRTVGGTVDYLDAFSPATDDLYSPGSEIVRGADAVLVASYSTNDPL